MLRRPIFVILAIVTLLILFGWIIFSIPWGGSDETSQDQQAPKPALADYADTDTKVQFIQNGEILSDEDHREIWITVGRGEVIAKIKQGYEGTVMSSKRIVNNPVAYRVFLAALEGQGFDKTRDYTGTQTEEGACPDGIRFQYSIYNPSNTLLSSWTTSCSDKIGTFAGNRGEVRDLFEGQVPEYNDFTEEVDLS